jgi:hypothetical protein
MGKQINSAKKMESNSKQSQDNFVKKDSKKIDEYFRLGNRKRQRDESEITKDEGVLKTSCKNDNQLNNIAHISKGQASDYKSNFYIEKKN